MKSEFCPRCKTSLRETGQPYCAGCHAAMTREWRRTHRMTIGERARANARSYVHVYVKRGKIVKGPCEVCGASDVEAHHDDYAKPLAVRWLCRVHHLEIHGKVACVRNV